ncbi:MAG: purine-nucleoside phosphorylase [Planctomycetota bacterium]|nr:purine-nucleoside phosphorylase [Planctomycetota bacterium]
MRTVAAVAGALSYIRKHTREKPQIALILGSGLGALAERVAAAGCSIPYKSIPRFPVSTIPGHSGVLVLGRLEDRPVVIMQGRCHYYEGYGPGDLVFPVRVMSALGAGTLIVTNSAGGIADRFRTGDLMLISDHLNLMGMNPLRGPNAADFGERFPDMSAAYDAGLRALAKRSARLLGFRLKSGVYAAMPGPSYETPAEIRMLGRLGADAVGMSTVPEVIAARHAGMRVLGISCITNRAAGLAKTVLSHTEVLETTRRVAARFSALVRGVVRMSR